MPTRAYMDTPIDEMDGHIREIAREEIVSLAGFMLRRLQDYGLTRSNERNRAIQILNELWGEALRDFGATQSEPGP